MKVFGLFILLSSLSLLNCCTSEKVQPIQKVNLNVTYTTDIAPFIAHHCISCHDNTTGIPLSDYNQVKQFTQSGQLIGCITADPNYLKMPPYETLNSSDIQLVQDWVSQGMKE